MGSTRWVVSVQASGFQSTPLPSVHLSPDSMGLNPYHCCDRPSRFALLVSSFVSDPFPERFSLFLALDDRLVAVHGIVFVTHDATWFEKLTPFIPFVVGTPYAGQRFRRVLLDTIPQIGLYIVVGSLSTHTHTQSTQTRGFFFLPPETKL